MKLKVSGAPNGEGTFTFSLPGARFEVTFPAEDADPSLYTRRPVLTPHRAVTVERREDQVTVTSNGLVTLCLHLPSDTPGRSHLVEGLCFRFKRTRKGEFDLEINENPYLSER